ncbi:unnamed protein product, partial [Cochlearia groenlandica]
EGCNGSETLFTDTSDNTYDQSLSDWIRRRKLSIASHKSKLSSTQTTYVVNNSVADDETRVNEDTSSVMLFEKHSPVWKVFESMKICKTVKHNLHFKPLINIREELREGLAAGEMVNYSTLLERLSNVELHTPTSTLERLKECFYELEKYSFNVETPISRINMMLSLKDEQGKRAHELKDMERKMIERVTKKETVKCKILELQSQEANLKEKENGLEKEIAEMKLSAEDLNKKI